MTKRILTTIISTIAFCMIFNMPVSAQSVSIISALEAAVDVSITRDDVNYTLPSSIVIVPISSTNSDLTLTSEDLYRGIYFYTVGRLGFNDIPLHYLVGEDGNVYKGNQGGEERKIKVEGIGENMILIGYMTKRNAGKFTRPAESSIISLSTDVANRNAITPDNIFIDGMLFQKNESSKSVSIARKDIFGNWGTAQQFIRDNVRARFSPQPKEYQVGVIDIAYSQAEVNPGEIVDVTIRLSNESQFGMYADTDSALVLTRADSTTSNFFVNNEWLSISQIGLMNNNEILLPFQSGEFKFQMRAPLYSGVIPETFELRTIAGKKVKTNPFQLALNVRKSSRQIIEINQTETGTLNVRATPSSVGQEIAKVSPGQRFFLIEDAGNGWIQIELNDGRAGWVAGWLVTRVQ